MDYEELVHTVHDPKQDGIIKDADRESINLIIQTDRFGLTVELPNNQHIIVDYCGRCVAVYLSSDNGQEKLAEIAIPASFIKNGEPKSE